MPRYPTYVNTQELRNAYDEAVEMGRRAAMAQQGGDDSDSDAPQLPRSRRGQGQSGGGGGRSGGRSGRSHRSRRQRSPSSGSASESECEPPRRGGRSGGGSSGRVPEGGYRMSSRQIATRRTFERAIDSNDIVVVLFYTEDSEFYEDVLELVVQAESDNPHVKFFKYHASRDRDNHMLVTCDVLDVPSLLFYVDGKKEDAGIWDPAEVKVAMSSYGLNVGGLRSSGGRKSEAELQVFQEKIDEHEIVVAVFADTEKDFDKLTELIREEGSHCPKSFYMQFLDVRSGPSVAERYIIDTVPTTIFFFKGQESARVIGSNENDVHEGFIQHCHRDDGDYDRSVLSMKQFDKEVASNELVVALFYQNGTQTASALLPLFRQAQSNCTVQAKLFKYEGYMHNAMAVHCKVSCLPSLVFYVNGKRNYVEIKTKAQFLEEMAKYGLEASDLNKMPWQK